MSTTNPKIPLPSELVVHLRFGQRAKFAVKQQLDIMGIEHTLVDSGVGAVKVVLESGDRVYFQPKDSKWLDHAESRGGWLILKKTHQFSGEHPFVRLVNRKEKTS